MAGVDLTPMASEQLPPIAYASADDVPSPYPENFAAVKNLKNLVRPDHGGYLSRCVKGITTGN
jgi:hypothetical protein